MAVHTSDRTARAVAMEIQLEGLAVANPGLDIWTGSFENWFNLDYSKFDMFFVKLPFSQVRQAISHVSSKSLDKNTVAFYTWPDDVMAEVPRYVVNVFPSAEVCDIALNQYFDILTNEGHRVTVNN